MEFTLVLTATGGRIHASTDNVTTLCGYPVDEHRATSFWGHTPDCTRCRALLKAAVKWTDPRGRIPGDILIVAFPESNHRFRRDDEVTVLQVAPLSGFPTLANYQVIRHPKRPGSTGHWIPPDYFQTN